MSRRRRTGLRHDGGASTVEYGAILILVAALAAVFTVVALPEHVKTNTATAICRLFSGNDARDCPEDEPPAPAENPPGEDDPALPVPDAETQPPDTDPPADPVDPALNPDDPDYQAYNTAKTEAENANTALNDLNNQAGDVKQEIIDLLKDLVGITDIEDCLTKGDIIACISALAGLVPWGKVLKILKKIPGAIKLAKRLKKLWDDLANARTRKKKADEALEEAGDKLKNKPDFCPVPPSSFLPGTQVLLADGTSRPIEQIKVGDLVWATDPATASSGPRPVTHLITSHGAKRLVGLSTSPLGRFGPVLTATGNHPFWRPDLRTWSQATALTVGATLATPGDHTVLTSASRRTAVVNVHNLTVAGPHTYYVFAGEDPVLVHNAQTAKPRKKIQLGNNYHGEVDTFNTGGQASWEMHIYYKGREVGVRGPNGWIWKHGFTKPPEIPEEVEQKLNQHVDSLNTRFNICQN